MLISVELITGAGGDLLNMAHIRQSRPDSGLGFEAKDLNTLGGVLSSLGSDMVWTYRQ